MRMLPTAEQPQEYLSPLRTIDAGNTAVLSRTADEFSRPGIDLVDKTSPHGTRLATISGCGSACLLRSRI
ncbi:hypothetical protein U5640_11270 [Streptomyces sp. SS7]|uniref:hypothetical protein n=1 Tax=Streptomyces sp. SS7 TaxID=3108485 RepID=UPI0030EBC653